jgi:hypothetical protein
MVYGTLSLLNLYSVPQFAHQRHRVAVPVRRYEIEHVL